MNWKYRYWTQGLRVPTGEQGLLFAMDCTNKYIKS